MRGDRRILAFGIAASLLAHLLWLLALPPLPPRELRSAAPIELTIESSPPIGPVTQPAPEANPPAVPSVRSRRRPSAAEPQPSAANAEPRASAAEPQPSAANAEPRASAEPPEPSSAEGAAITASERARSGPQAEPSIGLSRPDLSPRAAASSLAGTDPPDRGRLCSPRGRTPTERCEDELSSKPSQIVQDELNQSLRSAAKVHDYLAKREPPRLKPSSDGSYGFTGLAFDARIEPDGHVTFVDAAVARTGVLPIMGTFDLSDAVEKYALGKELYSAEKRWFLDQTAELRNRLTDVARTAERAHGRTLVERELERILGSSHSPAQKRAAVFELWEDCGDDADSAAIRGLVEAFIRARMPESSPLGFAASELEQRNHGRPAQFRFEPYRSPG